MSADAVSGLFRVGLPDGSTRLARGRGEHPTELLEASTTLDGILGTGDPGALERALAGPAAGPVPAGCRLLPPVENQEVWSAGVTYLRSRDARVDESSDGDCYIRVYDADRPEIFFKAAGWRVRGPEDAVGIRADSTWDVPEPELGVVVDCTGATVAYTVGNDLSSRSIEGENPLYIPQAKIFAGSCAIGPRLIPADPALLPLRIAGRIIRDGAVVYEDATSTASLRRTLDELTGWLTAAIDFPVGAVLLTGTCIVPPDEFTLEAGDVVEVSISRIGTLRNVVERVGTRVGSAP